MALATCTDSSLGERKHTYTQSVGNRIQIGTYRESECGTQDGLR